MEGGCANMDKRNIARQIRAIQFHGVPFVANTTSLTPLHRSAGLRRYATKFTPNYEEI